MAKRVYWQSVIKWAAGLGITGVSAVALLFFFLAQTGAITINGHSGDMVCAGTLEDPCYAYINLTANEDVFIYPLDYDPWGRNSPFTFDPAVKEWKLYRSWGTGWREIDLSEPCTSTWCGAPPNSPDNKYAFAFRKDRDYELRIMALKYHPAQEIKWWSDGFGVPDPVWESIYDNYKIRGYPNESLIIYEHSDGTQIEITLKKDGVISPDVFIKEKEGQMFFGANYTNDSQVHNFTYEFRSNMPLSKGRYYQFGIGNSAHEIVTKDICQNVLNDLNETLEGDCKPVLNNIILGNLTDKPNATTYGFDLKFVDYDGEIDPTINKIFIDDDTLKVNVTFEGSNKTHLAVYDNNYLTEQKGFSLTRRLSKSPYSFDDDNSYLSLDGEGDYVLLELEANKSVTFWYKKDGWVFVANVSGTTYVDGELGTPDEYPIYFNGTHYFIGKYNSTSFFEGGIDDFMVFNYELNTTEIETFYHEGRS